MESSVTKSIMSLPNESSVTKSIVGHKGSLTLRDTFSPDSHHVSMGCQMKPSSIPSDLKANSSPVELFQGWHKSGQCPEATIPIVRSPKNQHLRAFRHFKRRRTQLNQSLDSNNDGDILSNHEVDSDQKSNFFIYWTSDGYQKTGCENLDCPGFVQTNKNFAIRSPLDVSIYNSKQVDIGVTIYKSNQSWWLKVNDQVIGYWPQSIYKYLANSATRLDYGGEIYNAKVGGVLTKTQMGSGHFPSEGYGKASNFRHVQYMYSTGGFKDVEVGKLTVDAMKPSCYNIDVQSDKSPGSGTNFYFGGPGYSKDKCP
ncbi:uncharacterized protein LOC115990073 [Quercus lobata]|nr:uncharacterized protein LOC115990073 [Quercus lobata]